MVSVRPVPAGNAIAVGDTPTMAGGGNGPRDRAEVPGTTAHDGAAIRRLFVAPF